MELKIRQYRKAAGMTQKDLAKAIGKTYVTIQSWERGDSYPNAEALFELCTLFGVDPNEMLGWWDEHERPKENAALSTSEAELIGNYRESTPQWQNNVLMTSRSAAATSKDDEKRDLSATRGA